LNASVAIADKMRRAHDEKAEVLDIIGNVSGKTAVIVDDFTISAGTLANTSYKLMEHGASEVYAMVTHGVFGAGSIKVIGDCPLKKVLVTDTVENQPVEFSDKIEVVSAASLFGEAVKRIHNCDSISEMFPD